MEKVVKFYDFSIVGSGSGYERKCRQVKRIMDKLTSFNVCCLREKEKMEKTGTFPVPRRSGGLRSRRQSLGTFCIGSCCF